jgi:hypothetical protein
MKEIEKNGYNLNISRDISMATAEEKIDLQSSECRVSHTGKRH